MEVASEASPTARATGRSSRGTSMTNATPPSARIEDPEIPATERNRRPSGFITVCRSPWIASTPSATWRPR